MQQNLLRRHSGALPSQPLPRFVTARGAGTEPLATRLNPSDRVAGTGRAPPAHLIAVPASHARFAAPSFCACLSSRPMGRPILQLPPSPAAHLPRNSHSAFAPCLAQSCLRTLQLTLHSHPACSIAQSCIRTAPARPASASCIHCRLPTPAIGSAPPHPPPLPDPNRALDQLPSLVLVSLAVSTPSHNVVLRSRRGLFL